MALFRIDYTDGVRRGLLASARIERFATVPRISGKSIAKERFDPIVLEFFWRRTSDRVASREVRFRTRLDAVFGSEATAAYECGRTLGVSVSEACLHLCCKRMKKQR